MATQQALGYTTRFSDFGVTPSRLPVGGTVTITGKLQWHFWPFCNWISLDGKKVEIYVDGGKVGEATTQEGGVFRFYWTPQAVGTYYVKAYYPGEWPLYNACESSPVKVEVITPEQYKQEQQQQQAMTWVIVIAGVTIAGIIGFAVYEHLETQKLITLAAAR
jgi:hypothetical protein